MVKRWQGRAIDDGVEMVDVSEGYMWKDQDQYVLASDYDALAAKIDAIRADRQAVLDKACGLVDQHAQERDALEARVAQLEAALREIADFEAGALEVENAFAAALCGKARVALASPPVGG